MSRGRGGRQGLDEDGSGTRAERERRRGARGGVDDAMFGLEDGATETLDALREGGPRKREGGGARWGWAVEGARDAISSGVKCIGDVVKRNARPLGSLIDGRHLGHQPEFSMVAEKQLSTFRLFNSLASKVMYSRRSLLGRGTIRVNKVRMR